MAVLRGGVVVMEVSQQYGSHGAGLIHVWRHPRALQVVGRCIGHTDVKVMPRKARRLAYRIRRFARVNGLPACIWTSDLQRSLCVGQVLAGWSWEHRVDPDLREVDFGSWDGLPWTDIPFDEVDAWASNLMHYAPGGGEPVEKLLARVSRCLARLPAQAMVVGHGGWISAAIWQRDSSGRLLVPTNWPKAPLHGQLTRMDLD